MKQKSYRFPFSPRVIGLLPSGLRTKAEHLAVVREAMCGLPPAPPPSIRRLRALPARAIQDLPCSVPGPWSGARNPDSVSRMGEPLPHLCVCACACPLPQESPATPPPSDAI